MEVNRPEGSGLNVIIIPNPLSRSNASGLLKPCAIFPRVASNCVLEKEYFALKMHTSIPPEAGGVGRFCAYRQPQGRRATRARLA